MKIKYLAILFFLLSISINTKADWKSFNYNEYNFKIDFYQEPEFSIDSSTFNDLPLFKYFWEINITDTSHLNSYYVVGLTNYPSEYIHSDSSLSVVEDFINSTQYNLLEDSTFSLLSSTMLEKNGFPGKIFRWKNIENDIFYTTQVYLIENKLFELAVIPRLNKNHNVYINKFFNSFEILNVPNGSFKIPDKTFNRTYSIKFPKIPKEEIKVVDSELGKLSLDIQTYEPKSNDDDDNLAYMAMETKYPSSIVDPNDTYKLNLFYIQNINSSLKSANGELISINDIYYKGKLGKEFRCYISEGIAKMVYRIFYYNERAYIYGVITPSDMDNNKEMKKFFDSFNIEELNK